MGSNDKFKFVKNLNKFFWRTHCNTRSVNRAGYDEHSLVASCNNIVCDVRSACGKCSNTKSNANCALS